MSTLSQLLTLSVAAFGWIFRKCVPSVISRNKSFSAKCQPFALSFIGSKFSRLQPHYNSGKSNYHPATSENLLSRSAQHKPRCGFTPSALLMMLSWPLKPKTCCCPVKSDFRKRYVMFVGILKLLSIQPWSYQSNIIYDIKWVQINQSNCTTCQMPDCHSAFLCMTSHPKRSYLGSSINGLTA